MYFGNKQNKEFRRLEKTINEIAKELKDTKIPSIEQHNQDELLSLMEELNDKIEKEHIEQKRLWYKNFYKKILVFPNSNTYNERKMYLDILNKITPLQVEILTLLLKRHNPIVDTDIKHPFYSQSVILGSIAQLKNNGLITSYVNSIAVGGNGRISENIVISDFGKSFHNFCISDITKLKE